MLTTGQKLAIAARFEADKLCQRLGFIRGREFRRAALAEAFLDFELVLVEFRDRFSPEEIAVYRENFYGRILP